VSAPGNCNDAVVTDQFVPLAPGAVRLSGHLQAPIGNSIAHWNLGAVPYAALVQLFRSGRAHFAQGEMWGKAVRSGAMFHRYSRDPALKRVLQATVTDLLGTQRANGSISCSAVEAQPDGPGGDIWERKYVLLGLDEYYRHVDADPAVLRSMIAQADCVLDQIGPPPKARIVDQGWSPNHIESSTILEPILRLHKLTGEPRYLEFARYIVEDEGGALGHDIFTEAFENRDPEKIGGVYPKAYEMMSLFEGLVEYYRATGNGRWKQAALNLYRNIREQDITLVGNGGGDFPFHPDYLGECWDHTCREQTNPAIRRMMETCAGVTWLKFCSQILRLTGDPGAVDEIEKYAYNGLIGAMKPGGDGFSYVNLLNGVKTNPTGWGGTVDGVYITCCNLNGPMGLAYLPFVAAMSCREGPVINLFNPMSASAPTPGGQAVRLELRTGYPRTGLVRITTDLPRPESFAIRLRVPAWSRRTALAVNGSPVAAEPGTYARIARTWTSGDVIDLSLDMRCRLIEAPRGSDRAGDDFQALVRGPIVLVRSEAIDPRFDRPVSLDSKDGYVEATPMDAGPDPLRLQFSVPVKGGSIPMIDYAYADSWEGKRIMTWLPTDSGIGFALPAPRT
jgi:uncharacterized protein